MLITINCAASIRKDILALDIRFKKALKYILFIKNTFYSVIVESETLLFEIGYCRWEQQQNEKDYLFI